MEYYFVYLISTTFDHIHLLNKIIRLFLAFGQTLSI